MRPESATATTRALRAALDVLLATLVVLAIVSAVGGGESPRWGAAAAGLAFGVTYLAGRRLIRLPDDIASPRGRFWPAGAWIWLLLVVWAGLLLLSAMSLWIAFPLMFLQMHVLGPRRGPIAVAITTALAVAAAFSAGMAPVGSVLGPLLGAGVAIGIVLALEAIVRESQARLVMIDELTRTRADLAAIEREQATTAERERLAREIHDTLAQGFSSIGLLLRAADHDLARVMQTEADGDAIVAARRHLETAQDAVHENLLEARRVVRALAPPALDASNLVGAIDRLAARTNRAGTLSVATAVTGDPRELPAPVETALLRIAQSALANVVQHARASRAQITMTFHDHAVTLDVVDDGVGFDPAATAPTSSGGFGIAAMRSRVAELGGTLELESTPRGTDTGSAGPVADSVDRTADAIGTALAVYIPLAPSEET